MDMNVATTWKRVEEIQKRVENAKAALGHPVPKEWLEHSISDMDFLLECVYSDPLVE